MQIGNINTSLQMQQTGPIAAREKHPQTGLQLQNDAFQPSHADSENYKKIDFKTAETFSVQKNGITEINLGSLADLGAKTASSAASSMVPGPAGAALSSIRILYTNDIHGAILPTIDENKPGVQYGGVSQLSTLINQSKAEKPNALLFDGGDWAQGTYASGSDKGVTMMKLMKEIGYDATVVGNHDFDWGQGALGKMIDTAGFPVLGANIIKNEGGLMNGVKPYIIKDVDGVKVGIIGVTSPKTAGDTAAENTVGLSFDDPAKIIKKHLPEMKKQGAEMLVVISHCGDKLDEGIAKAVPEIDVIVGAHSHQTLNPPRKVGDTLILQSGSGARNLGQLDIQFDKSTDKIVDFKNTMTQVSSNSSKPDPKIEAVLAPIIGDIDKVMNEVVGKTDILLSRRGRDAETIMGNMITDGMCMVTGADVAFTNSGGIRADIKPGDITFGEVYQVLPFENGIVTMELTGKQLKGVMEESAGRSRGTIEVSGMKMDIDPRKGANNRVSNITVHGQPLDLNKTYKVATADFLAGGSNGYTDLTEGKNVTNVNILLRDALNEFVKAKSPFNEANARVEGRQNYLSPKPSYPGKRPAAPAATE